MTQLRDMVSLRRLSNAEALQVAEAQALRLLRLGGQTEPPVHEEIITELPGFQIERVATVKAHAAVQWSHGRWVILLNADEPRGRQRFSLAHELKHVLDHPFVTILYPAQSDIAEQACEYFAACLLMPRTWLRRAWAEGMRDKRVLARRFGVTPQAITVRLLQVGLIQPTALCLAKEA
jgi:Zn-dependent peptidase ImmA (M78 family)